VSKPQNARNTAYQAIREMIERGTLAPGAWLREGALSAQLGVSRTPLREALHALATEGLVEAVPNRGTRVASWSPQDIDELYRLRALLEGYGARQAARHGATAETSELWRLAERYEREGEAAQDAGQFDTAAACNVEFHEAVLAVADSPRLPQLVHTIRSAILVQRAFAYYTDDDRLRSMLQHRDIVRAIERGDEELAELAMRTHILAARYSAIEAATKP
jgi:DNA-binding GntR family transcriptional regulator